MGFLSRLREFAGSLDLGPRAARDKPKPVLPPSIKAANAVLNETAPVAPVVPPPAAPGGLTVRAHMELIAHEAIVLEAYKDSVGVWTWGVGVTDASGHKVKRYKGNPQTLTRVLEVYEWLVRTKYLPEVKAAFAPMQLNEHQLAAALSFHWNTGSIHKASWVRSVKDGNAAAARQQFMQWSRPAEIIPRRTKERDLFFDGKWTGGTKARVIYRVAKNGNPVWSSARMEDISDELADVLARAGK